jgi:hypothetical protein
MPDISNFGNIKFENKTDNFNKKNFYENIWKEFELNLTKIL